MNRLRVTLAVAVIAVVAAFAVSSSASAAATVKVNNTSKWAIHHFYLSPTSEEKWGPDQLGDQIIKTGESFTLSGIDCDKYDIKVVDEDGDECILTGISLCNDASVWDLTDEELLKCEKKSSE